MNWNDVKATWAGQQLIPAPLADLKTLRQDFEAKQRRLARSLLWRDGREAAAGLLVAGTFAYIGWQMGNAGWPIALAVALMLGVTVFFIRERVRTRRERVGADAPFAVKLEAEIAELRRQRGLLLSVGTWYLAPCMGAAAIVAVTALIHAPIPLSAKLLAGVIMLLTLALTCWGVWALNRWAVQRNIDPRLRELEDLRRYLLPPGST
jgi:hypothetical protein